MAFLSTLKNASIKIRRQFNALYTAVEMFE